MFGTAAILLFSLAAIGAVWNTRPPAIPYGTYALNGYHGTWAEYLTIPRDMRYVQYQEGMLLSQGTIRNSEQDPSLYEFISDDGGSSAYYVWTDDTFYQTTGGNVRRFLKVIKDPVFMNYLPET